MHRFSLYKLCVFVIHFAFTYINFFVHIPYKTLFSFKQHVIFKYIFKIKKLIFTHKFTILYHPNFHFVSFFSADPNFHFISFSFCFKYFLYHFQNVVTNYITDKLFRFSIIFLLCCIAFHLEDLHIFH